MKSACQREPVGPRLRPQQGAEAPPDGLPLAGRALVRGRRHIWLLIFAIYRRIILPNTGPAIATLSILAFRSQWDTLLWPLLVVQTERMKTLPLYIVKFTGDINSDEGSQMAVALLASIPMLILFFSMSKYFVSGSAVHSSRKG